MIRIIDETSPCAMTEIDIYKQNVKELQGQLQNAYKRIKEKDEIITSLMEHVPDGKFSTERKQS